MRAKLPWVRQPDHPHPIESMGISSSADVDLRALMYASAHGTDRVGYIWHVRTYGIDRRENGHAYGESPTMALAMAAAEKAALPLVRALVAEHEAALGSMLAMLPRLPAWHAS